MAVHEALLPTSAGPKAMDQEELRVNRLSSLKGLLFFLALLAGYCGIALTQPAETPLPHASPARAAAECVLALAMIVEVVVDHAKSRGYRRGDELYPLVRIAGKPIFLTTWILYSQTLEMVVTAFAEVMLASGRPCPQLLTMSYRSALFAATTGIMLTMLFLKFNYFEAKWRAEAIEIMETHGMNFMRYALIGHVPSLPVAILDITVVRDYGFLRRCRPSLLVNAGIAFAFAAAYFTQIHVLWWATNYQSWPYPFLHDFNTVPKRLLFFVAVFLALVVVMLPLYFLS